MKTLRSLLAVALACGIAYSTKAICFGVGGGSPNVIVPENEQVARIWFDSGGDTNQVRTVDYFTADGLPDGEYLEKAAAKAGIDYVSRSGTATIEVGKGGTFVDIPLIDNGRLDGARTFRVIFGNSLLEAMSEYRVRIEDNEVGSAVDPLFTLKQRPDSPEPPAITPGMIPNFNRYVATQPDGKLLVVTTNASRAASLRRFHADGTTDAGFQPFTKFADIYQVRLLASGKILVLGRESPSQVENPLVRLNADGVPDSTFSPPMDLTPLISFFPRRDGKIIVFDGAADAASQLNGDGTRDNGFALLTPIPPGWGSTMLERPDGHLLAVNPGGIPGSGSVGTVGRWSKDGILEADHARFNGPWTYCQSSTDLSPAGDGYVFLNGTFTSVDGFPRNGFARLFTDPSEHDFRVVTPAEFTRSSGMARLRVLRTGTTTSAASISYATRDDTARAGEDYVARSGTLEFAPLEVSKEVEVPLLAGPELVNPRGFLLELNHPSAGYTAIPATPVVIFPELRVEIDSVRVSNGAVRLTVLLHGVVPGSSYALEGKADPYSDWTNVEIREAEATGPTLRFGPFYFGPFQFSEWSWGQFFRAVKQ